MNTIPDKAFILAAGYGTRMRPLTDTIPKPLLEIDNKPLLTHICDRLTDVGVTSVVVNGHYLFDKIEEWSKTIHSLNVTLSYEDPILDTGGGVKNAIDHFGNDPFYVIAGDSFWQDKENAILQDLAHQWHDNMDIIIGLKRSKDMVLTKGVGDYTTQGDHARRCLDQSGTHMFTNIRINHPRVFNDTPDGAFSFLQCLDRAEQSGTLYAHDYQGDWHHISTPDDLARVKGGIET